MMTGRGFIFEPDISPTTAGIDSGRLSDIYIYITCDIFIFLRRAISAFFHFYSAVVLIVSGLGTLS